LIDRAIDKEVPMKRFIGVLAALGISASALAADVGVSVRVGEPGFYGRIDIGSAPAPRVMYAEPIVIERAPGAVRQPIYLRVPPGHAKHWRKFCYRYNACGQPVYFVQDGWYNDVYVPYYRRTYAVAPPPAPPAYAYAPPPRERFYSVPVLSVHAVVGPPEQRCWVERRQVVDDRDMSVPGAIVGAVVGGVLGHQVGGGRGKDLATVGGAVAGGAIGANVGRGSTQVYSQDVERCASAERRARPEYGDVTYRFRGVLHRAQLGAPPGRNITVNEAGEPRV
jgi:uncharacterized protein YcfJ